MRLTGGLKTHLSQLLERYTALVQKANSPEVFPALWSRFDRMQDVMYLFLDAAAVRRGSSQALQGHVRAGAPSHPGETTGGQATG